MNGEGVPYSAWMDDATEMTGSRAPKAGKPVWETVDDEDGHCFRLIWNGPPTHRMLPVAEVQALVDVAEAARRYVAWIQEESTATVPEIHNAYTGLVESLDRLDAAKATP